MSGSDARLTDDKPNASSSKKRKAADTDSAGVDLSDTTDDTSSDESNELSDLHGTPAHTLRSRVASHSPEQDTERTPSARAPLPAPGLQSAQLRQPAATSADAAAVSEELQAPAVVHSVSHARVKPEPYTGHAHQAVHISQLQLDNCVDICTPATQWQLQTGVQPDSQLSATWRSNHREPQLYSLQLVPDVRYPRTRVGVEPAMLRTYSLWARTCSPTDVVLSPLRVSQDTLYTLIHSLYSGFIDMSCDVEELLMLARHLQVSVVEQACINYLLSLNLEPRQLLDMASLFDTLGKPAAYKQSLQKLFEMPWTEQVMAVIAEACSNLLDQGTVGMELCRELLHSTKRGALCEMQVLSVLRDAGLKLGDPVLATLFRPAILDERCMEVLELAINLQAEDAPSPQLLYALLQRHAPFRGQADLSPEKVVVVPFCASRMKWSQHEEAPMAIASTHKTTDGVAAVPNEAQLFIKYMKQALEHERGMKVNNGQLEALVVYTVHSSQPHVRVLGASSSVQPGSMTVVMEGTYNTLLQLAKQDSSFCVGLWEQQHVYN